MELTQACKNNKLMPTFCDRILGKAFNCAQLVISALSGGLKRRVIERYPGNKDSCSGYKSVTAFVSFEKVREKLIGMGQEHGRGQFELSLLMGDDGQAVVLQLLIG